MGAFPGHSRGTTWDDIAWLCRNPQKLPIFLKGVMTAEDAMRCCDPDIGVAGIFVSNHGGRQLDGCEATADVLAEICDAVAHRIPVYVDGGLRRGKDCFRALALGASAVFIGRPAHYGLGLGGQAGVERVLEILEEELRRVMILCGCTRIADIKRSHVRCAVGGDLAARVEALERQLAANRSCGPVTCIGGCTIH
eukprot:gnl/TRDRNA2_/TRDRNA2_72923_c0_seq2.p1 gnl/TRDRNA2_/TRDRNA2_72923_c0~~gnl/TRDRNA2_/TRDRNA2_72923_c0_seq2.p1  ORF type:complete len:211 (+),score=38.24 gnl/TRDRNA2_/TRDRNA2_72923_c0_seq2:51-635(+)